MVRSKPFLHFNYKFSVRLQNVKISKSYLFQYKLEEGLYLGGAYDLMFFCCCLQVDMGLKLGLV